MNTSADPSTATTQVSARPAGPATSGPAAVVAPALARARAAAGPWAGLDFAARRELLLRWRRVMAERLDEAIGLLHEETGKVRPDAVVELTGALVQLDWAARNAGRVLGRRRVPSGLFMLHQAAELAYHPYGVVGVIGPWNYPVFTPMGSLAYALAAGNAVVFKPSEHTPRCGDWLAETFAEAVPDHPVLQLAQGDGAVGAALCTGVVPDPAPADGPGGTGGPDGTGAPDRPGSPDSRLRPDRPDKIAFTGSPATGARILAACAPSLTPVVLELGGKDAMLVAEDADLRAAADGALWAGCFNAGQSCAGIERVYVAEPVYEEFLDLLAERARALEAPRDFGRMVLDSQLDVVRRHIEDALARGARAVVGGPGSIRPPYVTGPVVLADVPEDSAAVREETFGPVLVVNRVRDMAEAVRLTNASAYGLGGAVYARSGVRALTSALRTGMISVNDVLTFPAVGALPFGGRGRSGFGRIHGADGLREFAYAQSVTRRRFRAPLTIQSYAGTERESARLERLLKVRMALRAPWEGRAR